MSNASDFVIENGILTKYVGPGGKVVIPENVTEIGTNAFFGCNTLTDVLFSNSVQIVGEQAFYACKELRTITFSANTKRIASYAFTYCDNLQKFFFSDDVKSSDASSIETFCFYFSGSDHQVNASYSLLKYATETILQNGSVRKMIKANKQGVLELASETDDPAVVDKLLSLYKNIKLDDLNKYIAMTSKSVSIKAFLIDYKQKLYSENVQETIETEKIEKQLGFIEFTQADWKKLFTLRPFGYRRKDGSMITSYKGSDTYITVPAMIGKNTILAIDADAFSPQMKGSCGNKVIRKKIESVTIEEGVVVIYGDKFRAGAFCDCSALAEINLPSTLVEIGCCSFSGCENLVSVVIPLNTRTIGDRAFYNCTNLSVLKLPGKLKKIGESTFENCKKLTIHAPAGSYAETYAKEHNIPFVAE